MDHDLERKRHFLINAAYYTLIIAILYVSFRYVIYAVTPFVIAAVITLMLKRPIDGLSRSFNLPRRSTAGLVVITFYATMSVLFTWGVTHIFWSLFRWLSDIPARYADSVEPAIRNILDWYQSGAVTLSPTSTEYLNQLTQDLLSKISEIIVYVSQEAVILAQSLAFSIPSFIIGTVFCIVATVFMSLDFPSIKHFILEQFTYEHQRIILDSKRYVVETFGRIITSYATIMFITMTELYTAFMIIGIEDAMVLSLLIAMFDILPALGTGGIMIPWILIQIVNQDYDFAFQLFFIYLFVTIVRNFLEPKIVGDSIGLHPVIMLMSIFLGVSLFGALGVVIMPFTLIVLKKLNDSGRIQIFNSAYLEDLEEPGFFELRNRAKLRRKARKERADAAEAEMMAKKAKTDAEQAPANEENIRVESADAASANIPNIEDNTGHTERETNE